MKLHLMFHGLGTPPPHVSSGEARYWLPVETFTKVLDLVRRHPAHLSFDDANASDIRIALPALKNAGLSANFFIPTDRIGKSEYLSEADILALRQAGMEIGSHGCAHIEWTKVSDEAIADDVTRSIGRLSEILNESVKDAAAPYGECDLRIMRVLRALGVRRVYSSFRGRTSDNAWIVRRTCLTADMTVDAIEKLLTRNYTIADDTVAFLREWRHVGHAALWTAK
jgi:peptidoglycan/xylan/chitin deacetylase (PgdA/CDA1 family)